MSRARSIKEYLDCIIEDLDAGRAPRRPAVAGWVRRLAAPAAVGLTMGLAGCAGPEAEPAAEVDKEMAADAKADGFTDFLCWVIGAEAGCDLCEELGWYGDGECDEFCEADPDCDIVALYGIPFEVCDNGIDDDDDGLVDCCDPLTCAGDPACIPAVALYAGPFEETECSDCIDNDVDGLTDCDDPDCLDDEACTVTALYSVAFEDCDNDADDDGDGLVDCDDPDCDEDEDCLMTTLYSAPFDD